MGSALDRRDRRYDFHTPGVILARKGEIPVVTGDVSFRGAFLQTETPPQLRQLVRVRLAFPEGFEPSAGHELVATGMVAHVVQTGDARGRSPGAGIEFYGLDGELRARWERFIQFVQTAHDAKPEAKGPRDKGPSPDKPRTKRPGATLDVQLLPGFTVEAPSGGSASTAQDISQGRMFIRTDVPYSVGSGLVVNLIDSISRVAFPIDCVVRRREFGSKAGLEVEFLEMALATWLALVEFLKPVAVIEAKPRPLGTAMAGRPEVAS